MSTPTEEEKVISFPPSRLYIVETKIGIVGHDSSKGWSMSDAAEEKKSLDIDLESCRLQMNGLLDEIPRGAS